MPSKTEVISEIKSGELFTPEYQEREKQRKFAARQEYLERTKQSNNFLNEQWERNKANRKDNTHDDIQDTWGT